MLAVVFVLRRLKTVPSEKAPLFSKRLLRSFLTIAVPSILQQGSISLGNIIIQGFINSFGTGVMAGYSAAVKLNNLVVTAYTTLGNGISNYASQNLGAHKLPRIREGFRAGLKMAWLLTIPACLLYFFGGGFLLRLFLDAPTAEALHTGALYLRILAPFYFVVSAKLVSDGILRGTGHMREFMYDTFSDLILRVVLAGILSATMLGSTGIWCAWPVGWGVGAVLSILFYRRGEWFSGKNSDH